MLGERWVQEGKEIEKRKKVEISVKRMKEKKEKNMEEMEKDGDEKEKFMEKELRIKKIEEIGRKKNVKGEKEFIEGWFEVKDMGQKMDDIFEGVKKGEKVMDYCDGDGGKKLELEEEMGNSGKIND